MKKAASSSPSNPTEAAEKKGSASRSLGKVHPVVIYPFKQPNDYSDLEELYQFITQLDAAKDKYSRPITVIDRKTHLALADNQAFRNFRQNVVAKHSDILDAWCVDTCQMWYTGLGLAFDQGGADDVYWLIPGDFNYGSAVGKEVLGRLHELPEIVLDLQQDLCIGEIATDHNNPKQLIDNYGTFALLYTWFPAEAQEIRKITERPRSEFFALSHGFLREMLGQRWFAYEQTVVMLLKAVFTNKKISRFFVGNISDLPEGRESFNSALQQVERTERVLKTLWRESHLSNPGWPEQYQLLVSQSDQVLRTAMIILQNLLR